MKKVVSIIISILFFFSLFLFTFFYSVQQEFALFQKVKAVEFTEEDIERYSNMSLDELHKEFDDDIEKEGLPPKILDYVVEHPDYENTISEFKEDYIDYLKGKKEKPTVNKNKMDKILNESVDKYNVENEEKVEKEKANFITEKVTEKVETAVDEIDESKSTKSLLSFVFNLSYQKYSFIAAIILLISLIIIQKLNTILYLASPLLLNGISFIIGFFIATKTALSKFGSILGSTYTNTCNSMLILGIIYLLLGISFILLYYFVIRKRKQIENKIENN